METPEAQRHIQLRSHDSPSQSRALGNGHSRACPALAQNGLIATLSPEDFALLAPYLKRVDLRPRDVLQRRGRRLKYCYFIDAGLVSVLATGVGNRTLEVGLVGPEGMIGISAVLGDNRAPHEAIVQVKGGALRIEAAVVRDLAQESAALQRVLLKYANSFMIQISETCLCTGTAKIDERLARWLLLASERLGGDEIALTHETLSVILGVRRASITVALEKFERQHLIRLARSKITVIDRRRLEQAAAASTSARRQPRNDFARGSRGNSTSLALIPPTASAPD